MVAMAASHTDRNQHIGIFAHLGHIVQRKLAALSGKREYDHKAHGHDNKNQRPDEIGQGKQGGILCFHGYSSIFFIIWMSSGSSRISITEPTSWLWVEWISHSWPYTVTDISKCTPLKVTLSTMPDSWP